MNNPNQKRKKHPNQQQLWESWNNEEMIWRGGPKPEIEFESAEKVDERTITSVFSFSMLLSLNIAAFISYSETNNAILLKISIYLNLFILFVYVFFLKIPKMIKGAFRKRIAYAFNEKGVYFKLWRWGDTRLHFIDFKDIEQISFVEYEGGKGTIQLISQKDFFFQTPSFEFSKTNTHPTLEMVVNGVEVYRKMEKHRQTRIATQKITQ